MRVNSNCARRHKRSAPVHEFAAAGACKALAFAQLQLHKVAARAALACCSRLLGQRAPSCRGTVRGGARSLVWPRNRLLLLGRRVALPVRRRRVGAEEASEASGAGAARAPLGAPPFALRDLPRRLRRLWSGRLRRRGSSCLLRRFEVGSGNVKAACRRQHDSLLGLHGDACRHGHPFAVVRDAREAAAPEGQ